MYPTLLKIPLGGGNFLPLHSYGFMIVLGFLLSIWIASREFSRRGLPDVAYDFGLVMLLCGLLGGRLFYYVQFYGEKFQGASFLEFFKIWKGGLVFYGGALGGLLGGAVYLWKKKIPLATGLDIGAMGTPAGMAFGRLGCFMNGCCHGGPCDPGFPLGVVFPVDSPAQIEQWEAGLLPARDSLPLPVHPVQLYQAAHDFALLALLVWYLRRPGIVKGSGMPLLFFMYGLGRFTLEFLRGDQKLTFSGLTVGQNVAILTFLAFGTILVVLLVRSRQRLTEPAGILEKGG